MLQKKIEQCKDRGELLKLLSKNQIVMEVGVHRGKFADAIYKTCKPKVLHLVDIWLKLADPTAPANQRPRQAMLSVLDQFADATRLGEVVLHQGWSQSIMSMMPKVFDWVYIDASHKYENVKADLESAHCIVKRGGLIMGHDYLEKNVVFNVPYGVIQAVKDFLSENPSWQWRGKTREQYASFVLEHVDE